jgi:exopolysaccharide biosynthesis polyprenyl glycosylphosphotransferase
MINPTSTTLNHRVTTNRVMSQSVRQSRRRGLTPVQRIAKRLLDIVAASVGLLLVMPVLALVALAIRLESPGPVLFRQKRVGEGGRLFTIYKFRSMIADAEALQTSVTRVDRRGRVLHKHEGDPRVTRVGEIIRKTSFDELPQLFNILAGDMSLVGPRPELPWLVDQYESWQRARFLVPQGLTGWWQVTGRSDKPCHLSTEDDLFYVENYSLWLDIKIILMTIPAVIQRKGAF